MAHANEEFARRGIEAFQNRDMAALEEMFADDIVWHTPGRSPMSGDKAGKQAVLEFFGQTAELTGGNFSVELHDAFGSDDHAVTLLRVRGEREGKTMDMPAVQVFHVEDGKVKEVWTHPLDQYAADEFWS